MTVIATKENYRNYDFKAGAQVLIEGVPLGSFSGGTVPDPTTFEDTVTFSDEILVGNNASVGDTLTIGNELGVASNVTVGGNLTVGGTTIVNGVVADPVTFEDVATFEVAPVLEAGAEFDGPLYTTGGAVSVTPEAEQAVVTVAGAIALTSYNHLIDTTGGVLALTLAAPAMPRQRIRLQMIVDGGGSTNDATLTFNGTATIVFADEGDYVELQHNGAEWIPQVLVNLYDGSIPVYTPA